MASSRSRAAASRSLTSWQMLAIATSAGAERRGRSRPRPVATVRRNRWPERRRPQRLGAVRIRAGRDRRRGDRGPRRPRRGDIGERGRGEHPASLQQIGGLSLGDGAAQGRDQPGLTVGLERGVPLTEGVLRLRRDEPGVRRLPGVECRLDAAGADDDGAGRQRRDERMAERPRAGGGASTTRASGTPPVGPTPASSAAARAAASSPISSWRRGRAGASGTPSTIGCRRAERNHRVTSFDPDLQEMTTLHGCGLYTPYVPRA